MKINPHIDGLLAQLKAGQEIATEMLQQSVEAEIRVGYIRDTLNNWDRLERITKAVENMKDALAEIEEELAISGHFFSEISASPSSATRARTAALNERGECLIEVTEGMINQNLLTFTRHIAPRGPFRLGEQVTLILNGEKVCSDIIPPGNKLRERGAIGRYYRDIHVRAGDLISLAKNEAGEWVASVKRNPSPDAWQYPHQF